MTSDEVTHNELERLFAGVKAEMSHCQATSLPALLEKLRSAREVPDAICFFAIRLRYARCLADAMSPASYVGRSIWKALPALPPDQLIRMDRVARETGGDRRLLIAAHRSADETVWREQLSSKPSPQLRRLITELRRRGNSKGCLSVSSWEAPDRPRRI